MPYGHFDKENKEFVITRPDTPLPWINYLGCENYCGLMSNTAGGYSFYKDARELRLTRYRYNNVPMDRGGRYLYIRNNENGEFWSPTWQPTMSKLDKYECRHGLGYTIISSEFKGIKAKITYFVPLGEDLEIWKMELSSEPRRSVSGSVNLSTFSFVEFCLWDALNDMTDYQYNLNIGETDYADGIVYHLTRFRIYRTYCSYFACANAKVESFDSDRTAFLGRYGDFSAPQAVKKGKCSDSIARGWSPCGAHQLDINLKPGETKTLIFVLGYADKKAKVKSKVKEYSNPKKADKALKELKTYWDKNLSKFSAHTEDEDVNLMVNIWNQYQCRTAFNWSRSASYYEAGIGRGMGFRDSNQDTLGFVHQIPEKVKTRIKDLAATQLPDGSAYHQYSPLTKKANPSDHKYGDDHLWLILSVAAYVKESGDAKFLKEKVPFAGGRNAAIYEHLAKAIEFSVKHLGPHKLPRIFFADWNDCLNLDQGKKKAESVMVAQMLVLAAKEMAELSRVAGHESRVKYYKKIADKMTKQINKVAWDGAWYIRAFTDESKPFGSSKNKEGKIFLETQPWSIISGVADNKRGKKCMASVNKHLATKYGVMLLQPGYKKFDWRIGSITVYPPGLKENGAIFCHPNPWAMIAECMLGNGDRAFEYYKAILPPTHAADIRKTEPYVYCQMVAGEEHAQFGEGKNSWLTGSAAWNFVAVSQYILGIQPDYKGLKIDPCIPKKWKGFEVRRVFRGATYYITVRNPKHVSKGIKSILLNGKKIQGNIIPPQPTGKEYHLEVTLG